MVTIPAGACNTLLVRAPEVVPLGSSVQLNTVTFVLLGEDENLDVFTERSCSTSYVPGRVRLEVQYY